MRRADLLHDLGVFGLIGSMIFLHAGLIGLDEARNDSLRDLEGTEPLRARLGCGLVGCVAQ